MTRDSAKRPPETKRCPCGALIVRKPEWSDERWAAIQCCSADCFNGRFRAEERKEKRSW